MASSYEQYLASQIGSQRGPGVPSLGTGLGSGSQIGALEPAEQLVENSRRAQRLDDVTGESDGFLDSVKGGLYNVFDKTGLDSALQFIDRGTKVVNMLAQDNLIASMFVTPFTTAPLLLGAAIRGEGFQADQAAGYEITAGDYWDVLKGDEHKVAARMEEAGGVAVSDALMGFDRTFNYSALIEANTGFTQEWVNQLPGGLKQVAATGRFIAAFGGQILNDPTTYVTGGMGGLGRPAAQGVVKSAVMTSAKKVTTSITGAAVRGADDALRVFSDDLANSVAKRSFNELDRHAGTQIIDRAQQLMKKDPKLLWDDAVEQAAGIERQVASRTAGTADNKTIDLIEDQFTINKDGVYGRLNDNLAGHIETKYFDSMDPDWRAWVKTATNPAQVWTTGGVRFGIGQASVAVPGLTDVTRGLQRRATRTLLTDRTKFKSLQRGSRYIKAKEIWDSGRRRLSTDAAFSMAANPSYGTSYTAMVNAYKDAPTKAIRALGLDALGQVVEVQGRWSSIKQQMKGTFGDSSLYDNAVNKVMDDIGSGLTPQIPVSLPKNVADQILTFAADADGIYRNAADALAKIDDDFARMLKASDEAGQSFRPMSLNENFAIVMGEISENVRIRMGDLTNPAQIEEFATRIGIEPDQLAQFLQVLDTLTNDVARLKPTGEAAEFHWRKIGRTGLHIEGSTGVVTLANLGDINRSLTETLEAVVKEMSFDSKALKKMNKQGGNALELDPAKQLERYVADVTEAVRQRVMVGEGERYNLAGPPGRILNRSTALSMLTEEGKDGSTLLQRLKDWEEAVGREADAEELLQLALLVDKTPMQLGHSGKYVDVPNDLARDPKFTAALDRLQADWGKATDTAEQFPHQYAKQLDRVRAEHKALGDNPSENVIHTETVNRVMRGLEETTAEYFAEVGTVIREATNARAGVVQILPVDVAQQMDHYTAYMAQQVRATNDLIEEYRQAYTEIFTAEMDKAALSPIEMSEIASVVDDIKTRGAVHSQNQVEAASQAAQRSDERLRTAITANADEAQLRDLRYAADIDRTYADALAYKLKGQNAPAHGVANVLLPNLGFMLNADSPKSLGRAIEAVFGAVDGAGAGDVSVKPLVHPHDPKFAVTMTHRRDALVAADNQLFFYSPTWAKDEGETFRLLSHMVTGEPYQGKQLSDSVMQSWWDAEMEAIAPNVFIPRNRTPGIVVVTGVPSNATDSQAFINSIQNEFRKTFYARGGAGGTNLAVEAPRGVMPSHRITLKKDLQVSRIGESTYIEDGLVGLTPDQRIRVVLEYNDEKLQTRQIGQGRASLETVDEQLEARAARVAAGDEFVPSKPRELSPAQERLIRQRGKLAQRQRDEVHAAGFGFKYDDELGDWVWTGQFSDAAQYDNTVRGSRASKKTELTREQLAARRERPESIYNAVKAYDPILVVPDDTIEAFDAAFPRRLTDLQDPEFEGKFTGTVDTAVPEETGPFASPQAEADLASREAEGFVRPVAPTPAPATAAPDAPLLQRLLDARDSAREAYELRIPVNKRRLEVASQRFVSERRKIKGVVPDTEIPQFETKPGTGKLFKDTDEYERLKALTVPYEQTDEFKDYAQRIRVAKKDVESTADLAVSEAGGARTVFEPDSDFNIAAVPSDPRVAPAGTSHLDSILADVRTALNELGLFDEDIDNIVQQYSRGLTDTNRQAPVSLTAIMQSMKRDQINAMKVQLPWYGPTDDTELFFKSGTVLEFPERAAQVSWLEEIDRIELRRGGFERTVRGTQDPISGAERIDPPKPPKAGDRYPDGHVLVEDEYGNLNLEMKKDQPYISTDKSGNETGYTIRSITDEGKVRVTSHVVSDDGNKVLSAAERKAQDEAMEQARKNSIAMAADREKVAAKRKKYNEEKRAPREPVRAEGQPAPVGDATLKRTPLERGALDAEGNPITPTAAKLDDLPTIDKIDEVAEGVTVADEVASRLVQDEPPASGFADDFEVIDERERPTYDQRANDMYAAIQSSDRYPRKDVEGSIVDTKDYLEQYEVQADLFETMGATLSRVFSKTRSPEDLIADPFIRRRVDDVMAGINVMQESVRSAEGIAAMSAHGIDMTDIRRKLNRFRNGDLDALKDPEVLKFLAISNDIHTFSVFPDEWKALHPGRDLPTPLGQTADDTPVYKYQPESAGYEVSSKGDSEFSALTAKLNDGRVIEDHYQIDFKGYSSRGAGKNALPQPRMVGANYVPDIATAEDMLLQARRWRSGKHPRGVTKAQASEYADNLELVARRNTKFIEEARPVTGATVPTDEDIVARVLRETEERIRIRDQGPSEKNLEFMTWAQLNAEATALGSTGHSRFTQRDLVNLVGDLRDGQVAPSRGVLDDIPENIPDPVEPPRGVLDDIPENEPEISIEFDYEALTVKELKAIARSHNMRGFSKMNKPELINNLEAGDRTLRMFGAEPDMPFEVARKGAAPEPKVTRIEQMQEQLVRVIPTEKQTADAYTQLWRQWADENPGMLQALADRAQGRPLTDEFAGKNTVSSQAEALQTIMDERHITATKPVVISGEPGGSSPLTKIISGGQRGADRLGLEVGQRLGLETGGTAPLGFRVSDEFGRNTSAPELAELFGLVEHAQSNYRFRTIKNVQDSDGTVVFTVERNVRGQRGVDSGGTKLTRDQARKHNKPYIENPTPDELYEFVHNNKIKTLNVAGNREFLDDAQMETALRRATDNAPDAPPGPTQTGWGISKEDVFDAVERIQGNNDLGHEKVATQLYAKTDQMVLDSQRSKTELILDAVEQIKALRNRAGVDDISADVGALKDMLGAKRSDMIAAAKTVWGPDAELMVTAGPDGIPTMTVTFPKSDAVAIDDHGGFDEALNALDDGIITLEDAYNFDMPQVAKAYEALEALRAIQMEGFTPKQVAEAENMEVFFRDVMAEVQSAIDRRNPTKLKNLVTRRRGHQGDYVMSKDMKTMMAMLDDSPAQQSFILRYIESAWLADADWGSDAAYYRWWQQERSMVGSLNLSLDKSALELERIMSGIKDFDGFNVTSPAELHALQNNTSELASALYRVENKLARRGNVGIASEIEPDRLGKKFDVGRPRGPDARTNLLEDAEIIRRRIRGIVESNAYLRLKVADRLSEDAAMEAGLRYADELEKLFKDDRIFQQGSLGGKKEFPDLDQGITAGLVFDPIFGDFMASTMKASRSVFTPYALTELQRTVRSIMNWWKAAATVAKPSFHIRNIIGGVSNGYIAGVHAGNYKAVIGDVATFRRQLKKLELGQLGSDAGVFEREVIGALSPENQELFRQAWDNNILQTSFTRAEQLYDPTMAATWKPWDKNFAAFHWGGQAMESIEDVMRMATFHRWFDKNAGDLGTEALKAKGIVDAVHFDYTNLTDMERSIKSIMPFYVWTRRNVPLQLRVLTQNPSFMNWFNKAKSNWNEQQLQGMEDVDPFTRYQASQGLIMPYLRGNDAEWARLIWSPQLPGYDLDGLPIFENGVLPIGMSSLNPGAWAAYGVDNMGPMISTAFGQAQAYEEGGDVNAPAGINAVLNVLDALPVINLNDKPDPNAGFAPDRDIRIAKGIGRFIDTAVPFYQDYRAMLGIVPNNPYRASGEGWLPSDDPDGLGDIPQRLALGPVGRVVGRGAGFSWATPTGAYFAGVDIEKELTKREIDSRLDAGEATESVDGPAPTYQEWVAAGGR